MARAKRMEKPRGKAPLTYTIEPKSEVKIRTYVDEKNEETGIPKQRIVSTLLCEIIDQKVSICSQN